jgi:hypothetical protein
MSGYAHMCTCRRGEHSFPNEIIRHAALIIRACLEKLPFLRTQQQLYIQRYIRKFRASNITYESNIWI